ncbi:alpha-ketoacid dehydrogenase subunit beta [Plantactinospora sp. KLBMP9567]|uniref:alpha-ketoacid dehydrogenase subunit beta n=1 Tax=Plantactinospora sp. KLBMP9567 TaxID=3085900 RepID=UPI002981A3D7|nr:transketolase C-terminal domain-containing protein [Plantactinospora sp. KLBMP9567]MDW5329226.1 transketolase C-terminal domain-containing protein [Plantactinospora sp. KLBMP9567]
MSAGRVAERLTAALHQLFADDPRLFLLGQDVLDPYGGAFGITRGLSTRYPDRVLATPISEGAMSGVAAGLALAGDRVLVEVMFGDFVTLCFDQIVNFAAKSVTMYGQRLPIAMVVRCPVGGNRGYGPTHSQNLQKHFLGVPGLALYELSAFHDPLDVLTEMFARREPGIFFEDKVLYTTPAARDGSVDDLFRYELLPGAGTWARVSIMDGGRPDQLVIAPGGVAPRALAAMRQAFIEDECVSELLVPARLYPADVGPVLPLTSGVRRILVVEDGVAGGGWGNEIAAHLHDRLWGVLPEPVRLVRPACGVIPAAPHLERRFLVQDETIRAALRGENHG